MNSPEDFLPKIKQAAKILRASSVINRNRVLANLQHKILSNESKILEANTKDLEAIKADAAAAFKDRLTLNSKRLSAICDSLSKVESLPDPLNEVTEERSLANGLKIKRVRSPLGVIFMIFESRPNVAVEAFSLAIKSGNAIILRGGKESKNTVEVFYSLMKESLLEAGLPADSLVGITNEDRTIVTNLLQQKKYIDVVVPRGGETLIEFVVEHSKIPIIKNDRGMCHIYVHSDAAEQMAIQIIQNAKTQRPGVCNAMETLLIHQSKAKELLPKIYVALNTGRNEVEWHCCDASFLILQNNKNIFRANDKSFDTEYLDYKINCKVVNDLSEAIAHIEQHGSKHSEAIITADEDTAKTFQQEVDAAVVYWNASTRFTDGFELGLGGELGISTQKLHVRGPVGLKELTSVRWIMDGTGQVRA